MKNAMNWFEIPVKNFDRARTFYEEVFQTELQPMSIDGMEAKMASFPFDMEGGVGGSLICGEGYEPGAEGPILYLNAGDNLSGPLSRIEAAGGTVSLPKTSIGPHGYIAIFHDPEGNRLALHSPN